MKSVFTFPAHLPTKYELIRLSLAAIIFISSCSHDDDIPSSEIPPAQVELIVDDRIISGQEIMVTILNRTDDTLYYLACGGNAYFKTFILEDDQWIDTGWGHPPCPDWHQMMVYDHDTVHITAHGMMNAEKATYRFGLEMYWDGADTLICSNAFELL
ncbi:MAG: hypothetical protein JW861_14150 [Bacteroidales bacterium]|nr:hypothetical protein [Bacteroidales bacterium]